ncbi:MAG: malonyl-ACP O-methyltransferase BioC [Porphyromonas sp.]|nr:malonyl-ACP O-methyltransferase BioC [Porphyromonas sp.]
MTVDQKILVQRFGKALTTYDRAATPQQSVAHRLVEMLTEHISTPPTEVLEIGCGSGIFTQALSRHFAAARLTVNDLVPDAESIIRQKLPDTNLTFFAGDAETLPWGGGYQLITSSSCVQWWQDPASFIDKAYDSLAPDGWLALSTYLPDNLYQLRHISPQTLQYPDSSAYLQRLSRFERSEWRQEEITLHFSGLLPLLKHLKETGTNAFTYTHQGVWSPSRITKAEERMRKSLGIDDLAPLPLTYKALLIIAQK